MAIFLSCIYRISLYMYILLDMKRNVHQLKLFTTRTVKHKQT